MVSYIETAHLPVAKIESYLHHRFSDKRLELSVLSPNGQEVAVKEWFLVSLEEIEQAVEDLKKAISR
ncbi:GIY-YIG nuclease family protein [Streptococcus himalayensis]|uniref:Uncharacterized protein n=1 Tax=Streptococcus himalayensis TaxID=1888195 RepID=A0A917EG40_9STRE|nr:GIY-YIG nuclease family protein [Streptococcus himalayensis]GGE35724.1 hypothetical protein GCM10011510_16320 [Streptococcus himalayensis]